MQLGQDPVRCVGLRLALKIFSCIRPGLDFPKMDGISHLLIATVEQEQSSNKQSGNSSGMIESEFAVFLLNRGLSKW